MNRSVRSGADRRSEQAELGLWCADLGRRTGPRVECVRTRGPAVASGQGVLGKAVRLRRESDEGIRAWLAAPVAHLPGVQLRCADGRRPEDPARHKPPLRAMASEAVQPSHPNGIRWPRSTVLSWSIRKEMARPGTPASPPTNYADPIVRTDVPMPTWQCRGQDEAPSDFRVARRGSCCTGVLARDGHKNGGAPRCRSIDDA